MRYVMRIAEFSESSNLWTHIALSISHREYASFSVGYTILSAWASVLYARGRNEMSCSLSGASLLKYKAVVFFSFWEENLFPLVEPITMKLRCALLFANVTIGLVCHLPLVWMILRFSRGALWGTRWEQRRCDRRQCSLKWGRSMINFQPIWPEMR